MWDPTYVDLADAVRDILGVWLPHTDCKWDFAYITACVLLCIAAKYIFSALASVVKGVFGL